MYTKTITYTDYNGVERTEKFYFNMTKPEVLEMEYGTTGSFIAAIKKMIETDNAGRVLTVLKNLILKAYGEKSLDGRRFVKSEELSKEFSETEAFADLYMELVKDSKKCAEFIDGIMPDDLKASSDLMNKVENGSVTKESLINMVDNMTEDNSRVVSMPASNTV